jgi:hypothetical protein
MSKQLKTRARNNLILIVLSVIYIFVLGIFEHFYDMRYVYYTFLSAIILFSIFTISDRKSYLFSIPSTIVVLTWLTEVLKLEYFSMITGYLSVIFFLFVIVRLIFRVANSDRVGTLEFIESINVYLLLGIAGSILFGAVYTYNHDAYNQPGEILSMHSQFIYYSFVTMTTLGYGDITPNDSVARSLSIFFSVAGQLYLTLIIAMLVGKYLNQKTKKDHGE